MSRLAVSLGKSSFVARRRRLVSARTVLVAVFAVLAILPLVVALAGSFQDASGHFTLAGWHTLVTEPRLAGALRNTVTLTLATQSISMVVGVALAWLIGRTDLPGRDTLEFAFWVSFFLPALPVVQGWTLLLDPHYGLLNQWLMKALSLSTAPLDIYSWGGIVFAHLVTTTVSAKVMMLAPAFQAMDARYEEAALSAGDSRWRAFRRITLPILMPSIVVAAMLGVVYALQSFETELVLGAPRRIDVYSTVIYDLTRADPVDFAGAFALGNVVVVVTLALAWLARRRGGPAARHVTVSGQSISRPLPLGRWRWPLCIVVSVIALMLTVLPLGFLIASSTMTRFGFFALAAPWTGAHWRSVVQDSSFFDALRNTIVFACGSAAVAVLLSVALGYAIVRVPGRMSRLLELSTWIPSSIPGVLFSLAWLWLILKSGIGGLYGSTFSLVIVTALAWITLSVQLMRTQLLQLSPQLEEAGLVGGASRWKVLYTIVVPLCSRAIVVVAVMVFVSAVRDVGHIALLTSGDNQPLSILQLGLITEGRSEAAAVVGVILAALCVCAAFAARRLNRPTGPTRLR